MVNECDDERPSIVSVQERFQEWMETVTEANWSDAMKARCFTDAEFGEYASMNISREPSNESPAVVLALLIPDAIDYLVWLI